MAGAVALGVKFSQTRVNETYAPPIERRPLMGVGAGVNFPPFISMSDRNAAMYYVEGVLPRPLEAPWRWTHKKAVLRYRLPKREGWKLRVKLSVPDYTFKDTGPVEISFYINDQLLAAERYATPGERMFEKPAPAEWLTGPGDNFVKMEIDKLWKSPIDGLEVGFILIGAGFVEAPAAK